LGDARFKGHEEIPLLAVVNTGMRLRKGAYLAFDTSVVSDCDPTVKR